MNDGAGFNSQMAPIASNFDVITIHQASAMLIESFRNCCGDLEQITHTVGAPCGKWV